jgi:hypothetical protein
MPILLLGVFFVIDPWLTKAASKGVQNLQNPDAPPDSMTESLLKGDEEAGFSQEGPSEMTRGLDVQQRQDVESSSDERDATPSNRLSAAVACLLLFAYSALTDGALRLLHCVTIGTGSASKDVLFFAGATACNAHGLRTGMSVMFALLFIVPATPVAVWMLRKLPLPTSSALSISVKRVRWPQNPVMLVVQENACSPFKKRHWHWNAALVLQVSVLLVGDVHLYYALIPTSPLLFVWLPCSIQRLITVMCGTLFTDSVSTSVGVMAVSMFYMLLQVVTSLL